MQMIPVRIFFSKTGRVKYTSHLDTMRAMTRAFARSRLPFWYTQGFNPHLYMTFALPIALGYEGVRESLDARLTREVPFEEVRGHLAAAMPPGFDVLEVAAPIMDPADIAWADYDIALRYAKGDIPALRSGLDTLLAQPEIVVVKHTKKGEAQVDIRPLLQLLEAKEDAGALFLKLRLASGNVRNINPTLFLKEYYRWSGETPEGARIVRTAIFNDKLQAFA